MTRLTPAAARGRGDHGLARKLDYAIATSTPLAQSGEKVRGSLLHRFLRRVDRSLGPEKCHGWVGSKDRHGYGRMFCGRTGGSPLRAYVVAYELMIGEPVPSGLCVMHICDNPSCVNTLHLRLGTRADNQADMARKNRGRSNKGGLPYGTYRCRSIAPRWGVKVFGEYLGSFPTIQQAHFAAVEKKVRHFGAGEHAPERAFEAAERACEELEARR